MTIQNLQKKARGMENADQLDFVGKRDDFINRIYFKEIKHSDFFDRMPKGSKSMTGSGFEKMIGGVRTPSGGFDKIMSGMKHGESNINNITNKINMFSGTPQKTKGNRNMLGNQPGKFKGRNKVVQDTRLLQYLPNQTIHNVKQGKKPVVSNLGLNVTGPMLTPDKISKNFQFNQFPSVSPSQKIQMMTGMRGQNWMHAIHSDRHGRNAEVYDPQTGGMDQVEIGNRNDFITSAKAAGKEVGETVGKWFKKPTYYDEAAPAKEKPVKLETYGEYYAEESKQQPVSEAEKKSKGPGFVSKVGKAILESYKKDPYAGKSPVEVALLKQLESTDPNVKKEAITQLAALQKATIESGKSQNPKERAATMKIMADLEERFASQRSTNKLLKPLVYGSQDLRFGMGMGAPGAGFESASMKARMLMGSGGVGLMDVNRVPFAAKAGMLGWGRKSYSPQQTSYAPQSPMDLGNNYKDTMPTKEQIEQQGVVISPRSGRPVTYLRGQYKKNKPQQQTSTQNV